MKPVNKRQIGVKYYRKNDDEDSYEVLRILRKKGDSSYFVLDDETSEQMQISVRELKSDYHMLTPHGRLMVTFGEVGKNKYTLPEVMVSFYKYGNIVPEVICRQNVLDPYEQILFYGGQKTKFGFALSKKECPVWIDFDMMDKNIKNRLDTVVDIYMDDCYKDLKLLIPNVINKADSYLANNKKILPNVSGLCDNLKDLLYSTRFWGLVDSYFGISRIPYPIEVTPKGPRFSLSQFKEIERIVGYHIGEIELYPYWYDIELELIQGDYLLLRDEDDYVWVMRYQKLQPLEREYNGLSKSEIETFLSIKKID